MKEESIKYPKYILMDTCCFVDYLNGRERDFNYTEIAQFAKEGNITEEILMTPISLHSLPSILGGECNEPTIPMVQIEAGRWHSLECLESGTVLFKAKDGSMRR